MFQLHFIDTNGKPTGRVWKHLDRPEQVSAPFECFHASTARAHAVQAALMAECDVEVGRVLDGAIRPAFIVRPDGTSVRPVGTKAAALREDCRRDSGRPCFCTACRHNRARRG